MTEWVFSFWQMLGLMLCSYYIGGIVADVKTVMETKKNESKIVSIDISHVGKTWYAFEEESKKFLVQTHSYEELLNELSKLNPDVIYVVDEVKLETLLKNQKNATTV